MKSLLKSTHAIIVGSVLSIGLLMSGSANALSANFSVKVCFSASVVNPQVQLVFNPFAGYGFAATNQVAAGNVICNSFSTVNPVSTGNLTASLNGGQLSGALVVRGNLVSCTSPTTTFISQGYNSTSWKYMQQQNKTAHVTFSGNACTIQWE